MRGLLLALSITILLLSSCASMQTKGEVSSQDYERSQSGLEQPFIIPAVLMDGSSVGDLALGRTTLKEALRIMPAWRGYPPKPLDEKPREEDLKSLGKVGDVLARIKLAYNPMKALYILFFDKNRKLVLVQRDFPGQEKEEVRKIYNEYERQLKEVYKKSDVIRMQAEIQPCITLEVWLTFRKKLESWEPFRVGYIFTCPTK
jgi:hypothetical protein